MSTKKRNNLYKRPLTKKKPVSFADALKRNEPMPIERVRVIDWLIHYNIPTDLIEIFTDTKYTDTKFIYQTDLLDYFFSEEQFFDFVISKLRIYYKINKRSEKIEWLMDRFRENLYKLVDSFRFLFEQKTEYKLYFSNFGDTSKESYQLGLKYLVKNKKYQKVIKQKNLDSNEIIKKLELLDIIKVNRFNLYSGLDYFLSNDYEVLKTFLNIIGDSKLNFKKGLNPSMNKRELTIFLRNNKSLKLLEICENEYKLEDIINNLLEYSAKEIINSDFDYIMYEVIKSEEDAKKYRMIANTIIDIFFPNKTTRFIENNYRSLLTIPSIKKSLKKSKLRIFIISGHGPCYTPKQYTKLPKINLDDITKNKNINNKNIKILSSQPYGRLATTYLPILLANIFNADYAQSKLFSNALWFSESKEDFNKVEDLLNFLFFYYKDNEYKIGDKNSTEVKFEKWKKQQTSFHNKYYKPDLTSPSQKSTIFDFVKYNHINPPSDSIISFGVHNPKETIKGIFEITENTNDTLKLMELVSNAYIPDFKNKMGLDLEKLYESQLHALPDNLNEITKYNYHLRWKYGEKTINSGLRLKISQIINSIYEVGDIKYNDKVLILLNQCRGAIHTSNDDSEWNTIKALSPQSKKEAVAMRIASQEKGYASVME